MLRRDLLRTVMLGGAAAALPAAFPHSAARADGPARRVFRILRDGSDIGRHVVSARRTAEGCEIGIDIDIAVKFIGITAYRYELENREVWSGGRLLRLDSSANDDGERHSVRIRRATAGLEVDGSGHSGIVSGEAVTTSYFTPDFIDRRPWISTQSGKPLEIETEKAGEERRAFRVDGDLETFLVYSEGGEWIGQEFEAGGERARYEIVEETGEITAIWRAA